MNDSIRPAEPSDIAAIAAIYAEAVRNGTGTFEIEPPDEAEMARRQRTLLTGRYPYVVVERTDAVVGYAYAGPFHARPAYCWTVEDSIYIAPQCQGRGLGRLLLARLIADAESGGFRQMIAVVGDSGNAASIALHTAFGFRLIGSLQSVGFKHGRWLDTVMMQRGLGSADASIP
jgi:L-amino acid N-acyltransferase YncA